MESCRTSARGQRNHAGTHPQSNYLLTKDQRTCLFIPYTKNIHGVISKWDNGVMQSAGISCKHVDGCLTVASWPWLPVASGPFKVEQLAKPETVKVFYIWWQFWPTYNFLILFVVTLAHPCKGFQNTATSTNKFRWNTKHFTRLVLPNVPGGRGPSAGTDNSPGTDASLRASFEASPPAREEAEKRHVVDLLRTFSLKISLGFPRKFMK